MVIVLEIKGGLPAELVTFMLTLNCMQLKFGCPKEFYYERVDQTNLIKKEANESQNSLLYKKILTFSP